MTCLLDVNALIAFGFVPLAIEDARELLGRLKVVSRPRFVFLEDDISAVDLPRWVRRSRQTTDGHLVQLARRNAAKLATLDRGIPGSFIIPV